MLIYTFESRGFEGNGIQIWYDYNKYNVFTKGQPNKSKGQAFIKD